VSRLVLFGLVFWGLVVLGVAGSWVRERVCFWVRVLVRLVECPAEGPAGWLGCLVVCVGSLRTQQRA